MIRCRTSGHIISFAVLQFVLSVQAHALHPSFRTIALTGEQAPGATPGVTFADFSGVQLNNSGHVAFQGLLTGLGVNASNEEGIWSDAASGVLALSVRGGDQAPGLPAGVAFRSLDPPILNNAGHVAFRASLDGPGVNASNERVNVAQRASGLAIVLREGDAAPPPASGLTASISSSPLFNDADQIAFIGTLEGDPTPFNRHAVFSDGGGILHTAYRTSTSLITSLTLLMSDTGHIVLSNVQGTAYLSDRSGAMEFIVVEHDAAPGTPLGTTFFSLADRPAINDHDQVAFKASLHNTPNPPLDSSGIWSEGGGQGLELVARAGNPAPGIANVVFRSFNGPVLNTAGQTAFVARLGGPDVTAENEWSVWSEGGGSLQLVARFGDVAPGATDGAVFSSFSPFPVLNGEGQTLFRGILSGPTVSSLNDNGIWAQDRAGTLVMVAREGDLLDIDDGPGLDLRVISRLEVGTNRGNEDGRGSSFNDLGQIAFFAEFVDDSRGVFLSNVATVPEPSALAIALLASLSLLALTQLTSCPARICNRASTSNN